MKKSKLTVCLVAGVLILAVSAGAAFGSVNGYAAYKNGAKKLLMETDNVTLKGSYSIAVDGKELDSASMSYSKDGKNWDSRSKTTADNGKVYESVDVLYNGVNSWYNSEMKDKTYYSYERDTSGGSSNSSNLLNYDQDSELESRMVTFFELAADTVVGDLKNNFVSLGKEDGVNRYQVDISESQVPAVVNAGLSLMAYSSAQSNGYGYVEWEDLNQVTAVAYEAKFGRAVPQELVDNYIKVYDEEWTEANEAVAEEYEEVRDEVYEKYYDSLEDKGDKGVLYVAADGSETYYASERDYYNAHPDATDLWNLRSCLGQDLALETVNCTFAVDDQGRLMENTITANFAAKDLDGNSHSLTLTANVTASDYGSTKVQPLELDGWTNVSYD